ncbi:hypothetical protein GCM10011588_42410 [Nocardia jinanensis]|uniref:Uncharacterized protein n=1 Tax=Nocardia jinanensis TaxID=382504 RepID=A0A917VWS0_9NOCA|nr:hypothetical protein GCM10011588_42410 [Nocardia jinanensis]
MSRGVALTGNDPASATRSRVRAEWVFRCLRGARARHPFGRNVMHTKLALSSPSAWSLWP